jgi:hypothetical protein
MYLPIDKMWERAESAKQDSDTAYFNELMYLGECLTKSTISGVIAAIQDDKERQRYSFIYKIVRANGIGEWYESLVSALKGPSSQLFNPHFRDSILAELTQKLGPDSWQYQTIGMVYECRRILDKTIEPLPAKIELRSWFEQFVTLRNRTRGHGAPTGASCSAISKKLETSIKLLMLNLSLFKKPWAYLHQCLSGKYRVTKISDNITPFEYLKQKQNKVYHDGVYIYYDEPVWVELMHSNQDVNNFFFPNGNYDGKRYQILSYINDEIRDLDATPYLNPATQLPASETEGVGHLDIRGKTFSNLPPVPEGYVRRDNLEHELEAELISDRHPIVTVAGRGGIGKTWLSLYVIDKICNTSRYVCVIWFSSRDIDLLPQGAKQVRPQVLTLKDIATEYSNLVQPPNSNEKGFDKSKYFQDSLTNCPIGPILYVFDNFETISNPHELYKWIDTYIRPPNKVLITTRVRDFKGDYPIEVTGMSIDEFNELVNATAVNLDITQYLSKEYIQGVYDESSGHPYVAKILIGELAKNPNIRNVKRIVATRKDILDALFERTYESLSPVARRVFLTLCNWRAVIPQIALEAVLLRPEHDERLDVEDAIDELRKSSFIEILCGDYDFLSVPLVAYQFGQGKLAVSPEKVSIEVDTDMLLMFGAGQRTDIERGVGPRIVWMFKHVAKKVSEDIEQLKFYVPILEYTSRQYPPAWLLLASVYEEFNMDIQLVKECIRKFIETSPNEEELRDAWNRLADICQGTGDYSGEVQARVELSKLPNTPYADISISANRLNSLFHQTRERILDSSEKQIVVRSLVTAMESRIKEANANDLSRLAWLCMHLNDNIRAKKYAEMGLSRQADNEYCKSLLQKIKLMTY